jgi:hypothetical protein
MTLMRNQVTLIRAVGWLTLLTLVTLGSVWPRDRATAQALTVPKPATVDAHSNNTGELATAIATPQQFGGQSATPNSMVANIFSQDASERPNPLWAIPLASMTATRERPMFSPTRRQPPGRSAVALPPPVIVPPDRLTLTLVGAVTGENAIAIFRDESTKGVVRLRVGQSHSGWSLVRVTQREATLQRNDEIATLVLPFPVAK